MTPPTPAELVTDWVKVSRSDCERMTARVKELERELAEAKASTQLPSKWVQQLIPGQTRDCIHGQLARKCSVCELEREVFDLKALAEEYRRQIPTTAQAMAHFSLLEKFNKANEEITRLMEKGVASDFEAEAQKRRADKATERASDWEKAAKKLLADILHDDYCNIEQTQKCNCTAAEAVQLYEKTKTKHAAPTLEECDLCHEQNGVSKLQLSESGQMLCEKCRTNK
jgi:uncharacterized protein YdcH (DUF465 family)